MTQRARHAPLQTIRQATQETLRILPADSLLIDYIVSIIIGNVWGHASGSDPLWGWIIGPPGSYKTEALRPLNGHDNVKFLSSLSENALVSGYDSEESGDPSLLPTLGGGKILVIKDFTAMLSQSDQVVRRVMGDLRDAFDGQYGKHFGTVGERSYKVSFGLICAVTPAIDKHAYHHVVLGERFLAFRVCREIRRMMPTSRISLLRHIRQQMTTKASWRQALSQVWQSNIDLILDHMPDTIEIDDDIELQICSLADLMANLRALPEIMGAANNLDDVEPELGSRLTNQLANLAAARAISDGRDFVNDDDMDLVQRVAVDTLPPLAVAVLRALYRSPEAADTYAETSTILALARQTNSQLTFKRLRPILLQYQSAGIAEQESSEYARQAGRRTPGWKLTKGAQELIFASKLDASHHGNS